MNLTKNMDMATVVHAMGQPDSGLEVRDRMWLKITIPQAFIGLCFKTADLLYSFFCHAMLCISAAYAVMRCLSVCHIRGSCENE